MQKNSRYVESFGLVMATGIGVYAVGALWSYVVAARAAAVSGVAFTAPVWLTVAAFVAFGAALALVIDDIMSFMEGGDSVTGMILSWAKALGQLASTNISEVFDAIAGAWQSLISKIADGFELIASKYKAVKGFFGGDVSADISAGQSFMAAAGSAPANSITSSSITAANSTRNSSVKIDKVEVVTQATDADGVSKAIGTGLQDQMAQVVSSMDDGVSH